MAINLEIFVNDFAACIKRNILISLRVVDNEIIYPVFPLITFSSVKGSDSV